MTEGNYYYYERQSGPRIGRFAKYKMKDGTKRAVFSAVMSTTKLYPNDVSVDVDTITFSRSATAAEINALKKNLAEGWISQNPFNSVVEIPSNPAGVSQKSLKSAPVLLAGDSVIVLDTIVHSDTVEDPEELLGEKGTVMRIKSPSMCVVAIDGAEYEIENVFLYPTSFSGTNRNNKMTEFEREALNSLPKDLFR